MIAGAPSETPTTFSNCGAVAVPADPGAGIVAGDQDVDEIARLRRPRSRGCSRAHRMQPVGNWIGRREAGVVEIVAPAEAPGLAVADPAVEAERRQVERLEAADQLGFFALADEVLAQMRGRR